MSANTAIIADFKVYKLANDLVKRHGRSAPLVASLIEEAVQAWNDAELHAFWTHVRRLTEALSDDSPPDGTMSRH